MAELTITAANVINASASPTVGTAGETITAGMAVYKKASDGKYYKAQADGTAEEADVAGIALHASLAGQPIVVAGNGPMNIGATTAKGVTYYLGTTAGAIGVFADLSSTHRVTRIGYGTATDGSITVDIKNMGVTL